jgi:hypothetical protein
MLIFLSHVANNPVSNRFVFKCVFLFYRRMYLSSSVGKF